MEEEFPEYHRASDCPVIAFKLDAVMRSEIEKYRDIEQSCCEPDSDSDSDCEFIWRNKLQTPDGKWNVSVDMMSNSCLYVEAEPTPDATNDVNETELHWTAMVMYCDPEEECQEHPVKSKKARKGLRFWRQAKLVGRSVMFDFESSPEFLEWRFPSDMRGCRDTTDDTLYRYGRRVLLFLRQKEMKPAN